MIAGICISAVGLWSHGYQPPIFPFYGPEGYEKPDPNAIAPTVRIGALLGRIGNDPTPFPIGEELCLVAGASGDLWFTMNDPLGTFSDNRGTVKVVIQAGDKRLSPNL